MSGRMAPPSHSFGVTASHWITTGVWEWILASPATVRRTDWMIPRV